MKDNDNNDGNKDGNRTLAMTKTTAVNVVKTTKQTLKRRGEQEKKKKGP